MAENKLGKAAASKSEAQWKDELSPEAFAVCRKKAQKGPTQVSMISTLRMANIIAIVVVQSFFLVNLSLMQGVAGLALARQ